MATRSKGSKRIGGKEEDIEEDDTEVNEPPTEGQTSTEGHETAVKKGVRRQGLHGVDAYTNLQRSEEEIVEVQLAIKCCTQNVVCKDLAEMAYTEMLQVSRDMDTQFLCCVTQVLSGLQTRELLVRIPLLPYAKENVCVQFLDLAHLNVIERTQENVTDDGERE